MKQVTELETELRGRCCRRDYEGSSDDLDFTRGGIEELSHCSSSCRLKDRSHKTMGHHHASPYQDKRKHYNAALDAMS